MPDTATAVDVSPPPPRPAGRPAWQRHRVFKFFSSVKLAVILLAVLIVASIAGTLYETSFDAKVARAYIYNAWWFNTWLVILCANLACAAFSRMPWKRHHTGFLITHLGIITLLIGAMIGRAWGIEGTMTIFKGQPPNNQLIVDQRVLRVEEGGSVAQYPVNIMGRKPTPARPWTLGSTPAGWNVALIDYAPLIDAQFEPQAVPANAGGQPAMRVKLIAKQMGQTLDTWLMAGDPEHDTLDLAGRASVKLQRGVAPAATTPTATTENPAAAAAPAADPVDESVIAFALKPEEQVSQPAPDSTPSGAKVRLAADASGKRQVFIDWRGATWSFDPAADHGKDQDLGGSGLNVAVLDYWPDFVLGANGKPSTASDEPRNPAVLVRLHGKLPAANADDQPAPGQTAGAALPGSGRGNPGADNLAVVYCDDAGTLTFTLKSSASPEPVRGTLAVGQVINTGWGNWQLQAAAVLPAAVGQTTFHPVKDAPPTTDDRAATSGDPGVVGGGMGGSGGGGPMAAGNHSEGVHVRLSKGGESHEEWAAAGWQVTLPTTPQATRLAFDFQTEALPIGVQLQKFDVQFNEGTDNPASFRSFVKVTDVDGTEGTGSCSMNHPFNYPGNWWNTFSGLTFKMSQASWNPENLNQSSVQILRDPGWLCKWVGSLLICAGIFTMFYLRPPRTAGTAP